MKPRSAFAVQYFRPLCLLARPLIPRLLPPNWIISSSLLTRRFSVGRPALNWLAPKRGHRVKSRKGKPRMPTGGSVRGTTLVWGDWGLRMCDHDRRVSAAQLNMGMATIRQRLRGLKYRLYTRVAADIGVYTSGNEVRMGKGKGSFDYWASRIAVSKIIFELKGDIHEKAIRDAFRVAAAKMPGQYEFVKKGDPPVMGLTKVTEGMTLEGLKKPWTVAGGTNPHPAPLLPREVMANRLPSTTPP